MIKKICLFPHLGYLSETSRMIEVYKALSARGETPLMASHGGTYEWILRQEDIPYVIVEPYMDEARCRDFVKNNTMEGTPGKFYEVDELADYVRHEIRFFQKENIGTVLTGFNLSAGLSARAAGCFYCVTHLGSWNPLIFEKEMQPPFNYLTYRIPRFISRKFLRRLVNRIYRTSSFMTGDFNKAAKKLGIEGVHSGMDFFMGDLTIVTEAPELLGISPEDLEAWKPPSPEKYHKNPRLKYAGPLYARLFGEPDDEILSFLDTDKPKIYVALTSGCASYPASVIGALSGLDARILVSGTVHQIDNGNPDVLVRKYIPSHRVMPLTDLAVIHGGQGSVQTAVASGTPILGFPLQTEQMFNLQLIEDLGGGLNLPLQLLKRPNEIRKAVGKILGDPVFRVNMRKLQEIYRGYDGPARTAEILLAGNDGLEG